MWFYLGKAMVEIVAEDSESKEVLRDVIVVLTVREPLIGDMLAGGT
jgi:hypothetical protein